MQRVFAKDLTLDEVSLFEEDIFHFKKVLRMKTNDKFEAIFNEYLFLCEIKSLNPFTCKVVSKLEIKNLTNNPITLFFVLAKGDKNDFVVQKATELGVNAIRFLTSSRSVIKVEDFSKKKIRFEKIALSASMQSKRISCPSILDLVDISKLDESMLCDVNLFAYEDNAGSTSSSFDLIDQIPINKSVSILIGPEGGISSLEAEYLVSLGFKAISLGKNILRTETAAVSGLSVLSFLLERR